MRRLLLLPLLVVAACSDVPAATVTPVPGSDAGATPVADAAAPDAPPPPTAPVLTTVRVHYPAGLGALSIRGSIAPLDWNVSAPLVQDASDPTVWVFRANLEKPVELKPMLGEVWSRGPNYAVAPHTTVDVYPRFSTVSGSFSKRFPAFTSTKLPSTRGLWVYLPPSYAENTTARFPVLYMHDGQNLFDAQQAFGGTEWKIDEAMNAGAEDGSIRETIVVGVENNADRIAEYTPVADPSYGGGKGDAYLDMLTSEVKPLVDGALRTLTDREHTGIMGSSLGGLISAWAGVGRGNVFGLVGILSPSTWWNGTWLLGQVPSSKAPRPLRVYLDSGNAGPSSDDVENTALLAGKYQALGYVEGATFHYVVQNGAQHNETYWAQRAPAALSFLLGPRDLVPTSGK
ncbi:MAG: alpha/beta hydrolase [Polyangiaceae bacterium]|nr:alpha/beta hydrolase [Polyangiaceae bacterium]